MTMTIAAAATATTTDVESLFFCGTPTPGLQNSGLQTPTPGPKSDSYSDSRTYCVT